ncbi:MAG TPA: phosphatase PAP2 family protein [Gaiellaceae bacterium]|nr:phosphatase PAP2 family protein [Gaiellaceae bacterium]
MPARAEAPPAAPSADEVEAAPRGPQLDVPLPGPSPAGAAALVGAGRDGHPDEDRGTDGVHWHPRRELRWTTADFVITGAATAVVFGGAVASPRAEHWRGGILFDEDARDLLRVGTLRGRYSVRDASDVGVSLASTWPFLVDALVTAWWYRGRADLARNMALVSAEAFALAAAVQGAANIVGSRERPFGRLCGTEIPEQSVDCEPGVRYRSFYSGHATLAFTSAGLLCANHLGLGLLGRVGDVVTCVSGFTVATMTGVFRVMSDMHYASDVALGALVGTAAGLAVPLLHLERPARPAGDAIDLRLGPVGRGLGVVGTF